MSHFAPVSYKMRGPEKAPDLPPIARLRRAGLTSEDEAEVMRRWETYTPAERLESVQSLEYLDDDELRRQIEEMREEVAAEAAAEPAPKPKKARARRRG